jgi:hypothetical protein
MRANHLVLALAALLAVESRSAVAETYQIDGKVWGWYQQYLRNIGNGIKPGAFAITKDGQSAYYSWCQDIRCVAGPSYSHDAVENCQRQFGADCVVFAIRDEIQVDYEVVGRQAMTANPPQVVAPVTRIAVSPDVQADIETYLRNAQRGGRVWSLAIAKDGSKVETGSCQTLGSYAGSGGCNHVQGSMQEQANRLALRRCGGTGDCMLLYVGKQKQAKIEVAVD